MTQASTAEKRLGNASGRLERHGVRVLQGHSRQFHRQHCKRKIDSGQKPDRSKRM